MFVFFVASSVGPLITPWEKRAGTYERLLSFPVTVNTLILGTLSRACYTASSSTSSS
jgi:ABC-2 type transport system permease protein